LASVKAEQVARAFDVTVQRVYQLVKLGMPQPKRGEFELGACMMWYIRFLQDALRKRSTGDGSSITNLTAERTRLAEENRKKMEMDRMQREGELLPRELVRQQALAAVGILAVDLTALPKRVPMDEQTRLKIEEEVAAVRNRFADALEKLARDKPVVVRRRRSHS
jgi:phage terminase Nu1 subunit (DNA packaging protein)